MIVGAFTRPIPHCVFTAFLLRFYCVFTAFLLHFYCIFAAFLLHFCCVFAAFLLRYYCILTAFLLRFYYIFTAFLLRFYHAILQATSLSQTLKTHSTPIPHFGLISETEIGKWTLKTHV